MSTPAQARRGGGRIPAGERLPSEDGRLRTFFCRACGRNEIGALVPRDWYMLARSVADRERTPARLGVYCSARCLLSQAERFIETDDRLPPELRQQRRSPERP